MDALASRNPARIRLGTGWQLCATAPSQEAPPAASDAWINIASPAPAAAALRERGQWSLDGPARAFDAQDWWYRVTFDAPPAFKEGSWLGFDGLATCARVFLNGSPILHSTNMFVAHECEVTSLLRASGNELLIRFESLDELLKQRKPRPKWRAPMIPGQQLRWWRTTVLGRTPGWSPPCAVVGPWKDVWLERRSVPRPPSLALRVEVEGGSGIVHCRFAPQGPDNPASADLRLERAGRVENQSLAWNESARAFEGTLRMQGPDLWWPHTHGEPAVYRASIAVRAGSGAQDQVHDAGLVGFRVIEVDTAGGDFAVRVNGVPVFCRGAVWTPLDPATLRSSPQGCREAVAQAREAGMNMLRVPGTGVYEEDHFYDACDEAGMLVWQEFMFANMDYPGDDAAFRASVELEARQQLGRLRAHPCLAVLCGNSEVAQQAAMWGAAREQWHTPLFEEMLPAICAELAPGVKYWPSSAHGGAFPHQASEGTTSYYGVGAYLRPLDDARRSGVRFAAECLAFANIPSSETIARMPGGLATRVHHAAWKERSPRDLGAGWDFDDVRDHYVRLLCNVDPASLRATHHERYLALGRMAVAEVMAATITEWRRPGSPCRGALLLMLRDLWAGAGWGVIDDAGRPKASYHALKRAMQPLMLSISDEGVNGLFIHAVNEHATAVEATLEISAWRDGDVKVAAGSRRLELPARGAASVAALELLDHFMDLGYAYRFGPLPCECVVATLVDGRGEAMAQAFHFPGGLLVTPQGDVGLTARIDAMDGQSAWLEVATRRFASCVHLEVPGLEPQDDYFHLAPGGSKRIRMGRRDARAPGGFVHAVNSVHSARIEPPS